MRIIFGYGLLVISCFAWTAIVFIPFLPLESTEKVVWASGTFVFAEVTWWLAIPLLGKEIIEYFRTCWQYVKVKLQSIFKSE